MSDPALVGFGHALLRTLFHAGPDAHQDPNARRLVDEAWQAFRAAGGEQVPVGLRAVGSYDRPSFFVERWLDPPVDLLATVPAANREAVATQLASVYARSNIQLFELLPNVVPDELAAAIATLHKINDHPGLSLLGRQIFNVVVLGGTLAVHVQRQISRQVAECLDLLHVALTAIDRFGTRLRIAPNDLVSCQVGFAMGRLRDTGEIMSLLASLDIIAGHLPPRSQQGLLRLLAAMVPEHMVGPVVEGCDHVIAAAGGPQAVEKGVDPRGIPLAGYWLASAALRERLQPTAPSAGQWGASQAANPGQGQWPPQDASAPAGWAGGYEQTQHSGVHKIPQMRKDSGIYRMPGWQNPATAGLVMPGGEHSQSGMLRSSTNESTSRVIRQAVITPTARSRTGLDERTPQWVESFAKIGPKLMTRATDFSDAAKYAGTVTILSNVASHWLNEREYAKALPIARLLKSQQVSSAQWPEPQRAALAGGLEVVLPPGRTRQLAEGLAGAEPAERATLLELLALFGHEAVGALIETYLGKKMTGEVKKEVGAAIEAAGPAAGPAILEAITKNGRHWNKVVPLIGMVGSVGYRAGERQVVEFLRHPQASVRQEAVISLYKMLEGQAERHLLKALEDKETSVRERAVALLAAGGSKAGAFSTFLRGALAIDTLADGRQEPLAVAAIHAFRNLGNIELAQGVDAEGALVEALRESTSSGFLGLGRKSTVPVAVQRAMCDVLGAIGQTRAKGVLEQVSADGPSEVKDAATSALGLIAGRG